MLASIEAKKPKIPQWTRRQCPKCSGRVFLERDEFGWYEKCLFCGYQKEIGPTRR